MVRQSDSLSVRFCSFFSGMWSQVVCAQIFQIDLVNSAHHVALSISLSASLFREGDSRSPLPFLKLISVAVEVLVLTSFAEDAGLLRPP
ncbi:hypothetical protein GQ55_3G133800 [Panicum hallii var. hallii]|uniref:Uncharacterized protein n=1 Tax=Panicum hallii var. hallii TaxID=1504633 RepID=A0A2T7E937_9POAL|nr:hypothetical protein GQ55_3G133800 [Panicum hallii var. hallii]PUZ64312.1 hypothetical protein GQ55_3G133800 [Panicum hallii var. hallii]